MQKIKSNRLVYVLTGLFILTLILSSLLIPSKINIVFADGPDAYGLYYTYSNNSYYVAASNSSFASIVIPATHNDGINGLKNVTAIGVDAFYMNKTLTTVTFEAGSVLSAIGSGAFSYCSNLSSIILPDSLITINLHAFTNCTSLSSITFPSNLATIEANSFSSCSALTSISIPASVTFIGTSAFAGTTALTSITVDSSNANYMDDNDVVLLSKNGQTLYKYAGGNTNTSYTIPSTVITINSYAFDYANVNSVTIPSSVITINSNAFGSSKLTSVTVPSSVTSFGDSVFFGCTSLETATINANITTLLTNTFKNCEAMTSVTLSNTITSIEGMAFHSCIALTSTTLPTGLISIGSYAFAFNSSLVSITLPNTVETIMDSAFYGCSSLTSIDIPDSMTSISASTFYNCVKLATIDIPSTITSIGASVFYNCVELTTVTLPNITTIEYNTFYNCSKLETINIPSSVTSIGTGAFRGTKLSKIFIPSSVTTITASSATTSPFYYTTNLKIYCQASAKPAGFGSYWNYYWNTTTCATYFSCFNVNFIEGSNYTGTALTNLTDQTVVPTLSTLSQVGYIFDAWYYNSAFTNISTAGDDLLAKATTSNTINLYAKLVAEEYSVTFDKQGGTNGSDSVTATYGANMPTATAPTRDGYTFGGYYSGTNGTGTQYYTSTMSSATIWNLTNDSTLYAKWTANTNTVTFDKQDGTGGSDSVTATYDADMPTATAPTRDGYTFGGYYSGTNGTGTQYYTSTMSSATTWNLTSDSTLYARWSPNNYGVTFNGNGATGSESMANQGFVYDTTQNLSENIYIRTGYAFGGWNTVAEPTIENPGTYYTDCQNVSNLTMENNVIVTLYAQWTVTEYTVTYTLNNGSNDAGNPATYTIETETITLAVPTRTGYTFGDWFTTSDFQTGTEKTQIVLGSSGDITLYAKFSINSYTITFNSNSGSAVDSIVQNYDTAVSAPTEPTKTGYTFGGWFSDSELTSLYIFTTMPAEDITLYADWTINQYAITFNSNSGSAVDSIVQNYGTAVSAPTEPTKTGYTFGGWYSDSELTSLYTFASMPAKDITLYADWTINQYAITFNSNSGSAVDAITQNYGTTVSAPTEPTKTGYTFGGWYSDSELTNLYTFASMPAEDITLYADWTINQYEITFNSNSGSAVDSITQDYATTVSAPTEPTKTGFAFGGWYSDSELTNLYTFASMAEDITLYADWTINQYEITFNSNSGSAVDSIVQNYGTTVSAPTEPTKTGYNFGGWYSDIELTNLYAFTTMPAEEITLYSDWIINQYAITFNSNSGSAVDSITQDYGTTVSAPTEPTKTGYTFGGWFSDSELTNLYTFASMPSQNLALYAKWEIKEITISFEVDGGTVEDIIVDYNSALALPTPTRTGYIFIGWYLDEDCTIPVSELNTVPSEDFVLYASWEKTTDSNVLYIAICGLFALILIALVIYFIARPKRNKMIIQNN